MVKAGADHGMSLLWALLFSCIVSYLLFVAVGRLTVASGQTLLHAIRTEIHPAVALFLLVAVTLNVSVSIMGVMGILADVLAKWSTTWSRGEVPPPLWAAGLTGLIIAVLLRGSVRTFEKLLAAMAGIMGICFLLNAAVLAPPLRDIFAGLIPSLPQDSGSASMSSGFVIAASMVGTTVAPVVLLFRSILVHEAGWTTDDLPIQRRDAAVSATLIFLISGAIIASAATSLHAQGQTLEHAREMITLLTPIAGRGAVVLFVLGITAAGISSQFPNVLCFSWLVHDYRGESAQLKSGRDPWLIAGMATLGLVVPIFHARPMAMMLVSQALNALVLPTTVICLLVLLNRPRLMGTAANSARDNTLLTIVAGFSVVMAAIAGYGLLQTS